jgi:hypothetical protein
VATAGNASASVAFTAPADTGFPASAITGYRVTSTPGGFTGTGLTSPVTVTGLTNGTAYTFTVAAQNVNGYGPESVASNSVTPVLPNYVEEVFSTYLYTGNGSTQTITNGIDLAGKGGLVWLKCRSSAESHNLIDTVRGVTSNLRTDTTSAALSETNFSSFNSNGFSFSGPGSVNGFNTSTRTYASWTFREQPKFFDIVTYTGDGTQNRIISHNLGSTPGCMIVKDTSAVGSWFTWHRSVSGGLLLNTTEAAQSYYWDAADQPTSTTLKVSQLYGTNTSGRTYVAYLFAHDAGGFGTTGADNVVSCGSFASTGAVVNVTLGYEPQFLLVKRTDAADDWRIIDSMRGFTTDKNDQILAPNLSAAETNLNPYIGPTATGFSTAAITAGRTYIYIAIRRGPMAVPTLGTTVFSPVAYTGTGSALQITSGFSADLWLTEKRGATQQLGGAINGTRLTGPSYRATGSTAADDSLGVVSNYFNWDNMTGMIAYGYDGLNLNGATYVSWAMRRAPGFFDVVCYTGNDTNMTINHNLGVVPELMIVKRRSIAGLWFVYSAGTTIPNNYYLRLETTGGQTDATSQVWNNTATTFLAGTGLGISAASQTYVAYLFATVAGVSKVGSYTGTGATQTIACGFAAGARFVLIKRTDSTGDWYVWDSVRGMVVGTDPSLLLNTTAAEVNANSVYTITTGFQIVSTAAGINASGGTYIFLAIA